MLLYGERAHAYRSPRGQGLTMVGEGLRQAREARGISLDNARASTGIPLHYLKAMESGAPNLIADEFYLIPFFRRYAYFLELDPAATVAQFLSESQRVDEATPASPTRDASGRMMRMVAVLIVLIAIALAGWAFLVKRGRIGSGTASAAPTRPIVREVAT